jgi:hypothetical protein
LEEGKLRRELSFLELTVRTVGGVREGNAHSALHEYKKVTHVSHVCLFLEEWAMFLTAYLTSRMGGSG